MKWGIVPVAVRLMVLACMFSVTFSPESRSIEQEPDWKARCHELLTQEMSNFKPPKLGQHVSFYLRIGGIRLGKFVKATNNSVTIATPLGEQTYTKEQITPDAYTNLFAEDYARVAVAAKLRQEKSEYDARAASEALASAAAKAAADAATQGVAAVQSIALPPSQERLTPPPPAPQDKASISLHEVLSKNVGYLLAGLGIAIIVTVICGLSARGRKEDPTEP